MPGQFRVSAKAVIVTGGRVLLTRTPKGWWDLPGGKLGSREPPEAGLLREIHEELGIAARIGEVVHCAVRRKRRDIDVFVVAYLCTTSAMLEHVTLSREHTEARLFRASEVAALKMDKIYKQAVQSGFARVGRVTRAVWRYGPRSVALVGKSRRVG